MLESLLQPFMKAVDATYEFVFVDGPVSCARGPGNTIVQAPDADACLT